KAFDLVEFLTRLEALWRNGGNVCGRDRKLTYVTNGLEALIKSRSGFACNETSRNAQISLPILALCPLRPCLNIPYAFSFRTSRNALYRSFDLCASRYFFRD